MSRTATLVLLLALVAPLARAQDGTASKDEPKKPRITLADFEDAFLDVAEKVRPGVVAIEVRHGGERDHDAERSVLFSGVAWDNSGTIVAIGRDLDSANEILVSPFEGEAVKARFAGSDDETGLCILKLESMPKGLVALEHGPVEKLRPGSFCIAVGNPVGLRHSVAFGHVAGTGRTVRRGTVTTKDAIQVTLAVNPGDPGGLLADSRGRLVGVLSSSLRRPEGAGRPPSDRQMRRILEGLQKKGEKGGEMPDFGALMEMLRPQFDNVSQLFAQNVSFAIPVDTIAKAVERIRTNPGRPWLGVDVGMLEDERVREEMGMERDKGVVITGVKPGSPAEKANLQARDVVTKWNNDPVKSTRELQHLVRGTAVGTTVKLELLRGKETLTVSVTLEGHVDGKSPEEKK
ncbi:MAG TPA: S1C family serine protease [Planctomycetota bacterium]|nr:S1C family serine protease [Planctomycetota bacterium]